MAATLYKSTDSGAPTLSGTAGDLVNLLDKILVSGYGAQPAAGWGILYNTATQAVFRPGAGTRLYFNVDDDGTISAAKEAYVRGYESMTAFGAGADPFPTVAQLANGQVIQKSATSDSTARAWECIADNKRFLLLVQNAQSTSGEWTPYFVGDIVSFAASDSYCFLVACRENVSAASPGNGVNALLTTMGSGLYRYIARDSTGVSKSYKPSLLSNAAYQATTMGQDLALAYPTYGNKLVYAKLLVAENNGTNSVFRGELPWAFDLCHDFDAIGSPLSDGDTFLDGTDEFVIRSVVSSCAVVLRTNNLTV